MPRFVKCPECGGRSHGCAECEGTGVIEASYAEALREQQIWEGDGRKPLTLTQALALLPDGDTIHTVRNNTPGALLGADWPREKIVALVREHGAELAGPAATGSGHGLYVEDEHGRLFIATRPAESRDRRAGQATVGR